MSKVDLVIIFNHRFDKNIEKLNIIYRERFNRIFFLLPFYDGDANDVIPVYECSFQFPGFLIQAYDKLLESDADYYLFIGDDLILSPDINAGNVLNALNMEEKDVWVPNIRPLNGKDGFMWNHARYSSPPFLKKHQTNWEGSIPEYQSALTLFQDFFHEKYIEEYGADFFGSENYDNKDREIEDFIQRNGNTLKIPYPMARGYADIFMIKREKLFPISRLCGVFSAMNLFAEISFPTAIVLSVERKNVAFLKDTEFNMRIEWDEARAVLEEKYSYNLKLLFKDWENKLLFIHPVKISKWDLS